jgi:hypothetical protein
MPRTSTRSTSCYEPAYTSYVLHVPPRDPNDPPFETLSPPVKGNEPDPEPPQWEQDPYVKTDLRRLARRLLRSWVALGVTIILIVAFVLAWRARGPARQPPIAVTYAEIVQVRVLPGPHPGPAHIFARSPETIPGAKPLEVLQAAIPSTFPAPVRCVSAYGTEEDLVLRVVLVDGRKLDYGSLCLPDELEPLYELAIAN